MKLYLLLILCTLDRKYTKLSNNYNLSLINFQTLNHCRKDQDKKSTSTDRRGLF